MNNLDIAKKYFEVSNISNFEEIQKLLSESITYSSQNTGLFLGIESIITMQKAFHGSFQKLNWEIKDICEEKDGIIKIDFIFLGAKDGEEIKFSGIEYIIVYKGKIQHIEIRNK